MAKGFKQLFIDSFNEYKKNYRLYLTIIILFFFIPSLISFILEIPLNANLAALGKDPTPEQVFTAITTSNVLLPLAIISIIAFLLNLFASSSLIYSSLNNKYKFKDAMNGGKKYFFKYLVFNIVLIIFLILLYLALIIPGIIFSIFWILSPYVLINENKGIIDSLKQSKSLIKGKWWKTLGYLLLFLIIIIIIGIIISIIGSIIDKLTFSTITSLLNFIKEQVTYIIFLPLGIIFFKNYYLELKNKESKEPSKKKK